MTWTPTFSVVMATYNRGRHIVPSIESVLRQSMDDFELLVVGDGCTDDTEGAVRSLASPKVRWIGRTKRGGSQSYPNNDGIRAAAGAYIAYLGHDDLWSASHLEALRATIWDEAPDFAVSGAIFHMPNGAAAGQVTGLFEDGEAAQFTHFFPPSSIAHRADVMRRIGWWRAPEQISAPVDCDLLLRAARAGMRFAPTNAVTVHKFAAGHRYLSYLEQTSDEQRRMASRLEEAGADRWVEREVERSRREGTFMIHRYPDFDHFGLGELAEQNARRKGLRAAVAEPLAGPVRIAQPHDDAVLDWTGEPVRGLRWATLNPRPRMLVPHSFAGTAMAEIAIAHADGNALGGLAVSCNGETVEAAVSRPVRGPDGWEATAYAPLPLRSVGHSIVTFELTFAQRPLPPGRGIGVGEVRLAPLPDDADGLRAEIARQRRTICDYALEAERLNGELAGAGAVIERTHAEASGRPSEIDALADRVRSITESKSWRYTAVFRAVAAVVQGMRHPGR